MDEREEEHTDVENELMREMFTHILQTSWDCVEVADEYNPIEYDFYVSTAIRIFEKGKKTLDVGNFLMEQETKIKKLAETVTKTTISPTNLVLLTTN